MAITTINPATGENLHTYQEMSPEEVQGQLKKTAAAQKEWRGTSFHARGVKMRRLADVLQQRREQLALMASHEMGKPIKQARAEVDKCSNCCSFYADNAEKFLSHEQIQTEASHSFVAFEPLGVVLAVMPWNFPYWQVFRCACPAIMAGNGLVLKHASNVFGCALAMEEIFRAAGFPEGLFRTLLIGSKQVAAVIQDPAVQAVALTGSTPAGKSVASTAGSVLKKCVLELGGSDAYVVLKDADLEAAAEACVASRLINTGQSCIAAKRFIVEREVRPQFEDLFVQKMKARIMGDPLDEKTDLGPLARVDLRDELHDQVQRSLAQGAQLLCGGTVPDRKGAFYPATVLTGVTKGMTAYEEETFGPVAAIIEVANEDAAIEAANDTIFGLGAAIFTRDKARGERLATERINAGSCFVNDYVRSDPRLPFGGIKESGYGRELSSYGIREFVNIKTIYVK